MKNERDFIALESFLRSIPGVHSSLGHGVENDGRWWVKFSIDIENKLAWHVVQELGHVLNYLSVEGRLPTAFKPVSPPPYMNGGPKEFLSWVIECPEPSFKPGAVAKLLEERLPQPVNDISQWGNGE